ncbi:MAG: cysteine--tRNA ligase [Bacillota bacterium]
MKIYNTLTRKKEVFKPMNPPEVKMYVCGPTVYDYFHIGNARPFLLFDAFRNYLEYKGYNVKYVQNFTDIDDKIINKANKLDKSPKEISEKFIEEYFKDADALGIQRADVYPKVSETIDEIIDFIQVLLDKDYAYSVNGNVYFRAENVENYGKLAKQDIKELDIGSRIKENSEKHNALDFTLWKAKKPNEPSWEAPWGEGRPGWHIECSVMSTSILGDTLDIHAGGQDLTFPHHENEIAQSESKTGKKYVNYWMHNGYINIDNKKMSKSKGNFFTVREILEKYDPEIIRFFLLSAHYRSPINFSEDLIKSAANGLDRLYNAKNNMEFLLKNAKASNLNKDVEKKVNKHKKDFIKMMDDDFNTANGIAAIFELTKDLNKLLDNNSSKETIEYSLKIFNELTNVLGIVKQEKINDEEIQEMIDKRQKARKNKNYQLADEIRDELEEKGIELMDTPEGVKWRKKK